MPLRSALCVIRHSPDSRPFRGQDRVSDRLGQRQIAVATSKGPSKLVVDGGPTLKRSALLVPRHTSPHCPVHLASARHAGAGGTRSRAISDRISANICQGTATSANWKVV